MIAMKFFPRQKWQAAALIVLIVLVMVVLGSMKRPWHSVFSTGVASGPPSARKLGVRVTEELRRQYIEQAALFIGGPIPTPAEIRQGPDPAHGFGLDDVVYCRYVLHQNNGSNPKFRCYRTDEAGHLVDKKGRVHENVRSVNRHRQLIAHDGEVLGKADELEIKYFQSRKNDSGYELTKDMYTEVAATRLLWMLGFPADRMYSVREVVCFGCPDNPYKNAGKRATRRYPFAAVERKFPGKTVRMSGKPAGWSWHEARSTGWLNETRAHFQALQILLGVINHVANQAFQNRIRCKKKHIDKNGICLQPALLVHDLGATFGSQESMDAPLFKGSLQSWRAQPVWRDPEKCLLELQFCGDEATCESAARYRVGEQGRQLLIARWNQLTEDHLRALFESARFERVDQEQYQRIEHHLSTAVLNQAERALLVRDSVIQEWIEVLQDKMRQVKDVQCPDAEL